MNATARTKMVDEINDRREESIVSVVGGRVCEEPPISRGS